MPLVGSSLTADLLTLALIVGIIVSCGAVVGMVVTYGGRQRPARRAVPPPTVLPAPSATVAAARARARAAAEQLGEPTAPLELGPAPAGPRRPRPDGVRGRPPTVDEVRNVVDELIATNPEYLAEVITQWIHTQPADRAHRSATGPARRRPGT